MAPRCLIDTLENAMLEQVFGGVPSAERVLVVPLVCKRWARILAQPSAAWADSEIDLQDLHEHYEWRDDGLPYLDARVVSAWFSRRSNCVRRLTLYDELYTETMPAALTASMLSSQCGSLVELDVAAPVVGLAGPNVAILAALTRLTLLEVAVYHGGDHSAALIWTVAGLPALLDLTIRFYDISMSAEDADNAGLGLPRCRELADLHSRSLTRLRVDSLGGPEDVNTLRLVGLPELRSCQLRGDWRSPRTLRTDIASFRGAPQLQRLSLYRLPDCEVQHDSLGQLTGLTSLTVDGCGLRCVPAAVVASLSASLRVLHMSSNDRLQVDGAAVAAVLQCSRLTTLGLYKPGVVKWRVRPDVWEPIARHQEEEGYTKAHYSVESLRHMMQLPLAFYNKYARDLMVCVTDDEHQKYLGCYRDSRF